ncbi:MAG TPA: hypothetical protein PLR99_08975 [Polyangiaceae bacterium]|nr:hypothetical protein [Polyangiaceae bacterium]
MKPQTLFLSAAVSIAAAVLGQGCAAQVALEDRPCPCAEGWTCCPSNNVCVSEGTSCPGSGLGVLGPDAGDAALGPLGVGADPIELARGQSARCLLAAGDYVYWQNADGLVAGAPRAGGAFEVSHFRTPLADNPQCGIAVEGDTLFATSYSLGKVLELSLRSNGEWVIGASGTLYGQLTTPSSIAVTQEAVIVTELDAGRVTAIARARAVPVVLAEGQVRPDDVRVFTSFDGTFAYFVERGTRGSASGAIKRVKATLAGDAVVETLATGLDEPRGLEAIDGQLYFVARAGFYSVPLTGGVPRLVLPDPLSGNAPFAVDPSFAYLYKGGGIAKVRLTDGSVVTPRYSQTGMPIALAVDGGRVFWADGASVWSSAK